MIIIFGIVSIKQITYIFPKSKICQMGNLSSENEAWLDVKNSKKQRLRTAQYHFSQPPWHIRMIRGINFASFMGIDRSAWGLNPIYTRKDPNVVSTAWFLMY